MIKCAIKIIKKLMFQKIFYKIFSVFALKETLPSEKEAYRLLSEFSGDYGKSCVCNNNMHQLRWDLEVIVPAFNAEAYIGECICSILNQTTNYNFHITVIDDGSTDNTLKIIEKYNTDDRITILTQKNGGSAKARNLALKNIFSNYVMFVDADDMLERDAIEKMVKQAYLVDADAVEGGYYLLHKKRKIVGKKIQDKFYDHALGVLSGFTCMKIVRAKLFENISFPEGYWFEDSVMSMILFPQMKRVATIHDMIYTYRVNEDGMTSKARYNRKALDSFWVMKRLQDDFNSLEIPKSYESYVQFLCQIHITYLRTQGLPKDIKKSVFKLTQNILNKNYKNIESENWKIQALEKALRSGNYKKYCLLSALNDDLS